MAKNIKTRQGLRNIKILNKAVGLSERMKNAFVRTKSKVDETQAPPHSSPIDYATEKVQDTTQEAARETAYQVKTLGKRLLLRKKPKVEVIRQKPQIVVKQKQTEVKLINKSRASPVAKSAFPPKAETLSGRSVGKNPVRVHKPPASTTPNTSIVKVSSQSPKVRLVENRIKLKIVSPKVKDGTVNTIAEIKPLVRVLCKNNLTSNTVGQRIRKLSAIRKRLANGGVTSQKTAFAQPVQSTKSLADTPPKRGVYRVSNTNQPQKGADKPAKALQTTEKAVKSTKKGFKKTSKGTVKAAAKSIKSGKKAVVSTAKTAEKSAQAAAKAAKAAKKSAQAARVAAKTAATTAKAAVKAVTAMIKLSIAAIKGLIAALAAGGSVAMIVILVICLIGLLIGSIFGIFFSGEPSQSGNTINSVIAEIDSEYMAKIDDIISSNSHDLLDMSGARASWKEVLAVYTVKTVNDPDNPMEVATVDDERAALLRSVFWEMNVISHSVDSVDVEEDVLDDDDIPTRETETVTKTVLRITVSHKTTEEMAEVYGFNEIQMAQLEELLKSEYYALWNSLLYGIASIGDGSIVEVAATQIGNVGGEPYWSWYGFSGRVEWCACFVSWCADVCGYIEAGIIPKFASCVAGEQWFKSRGQWQDRNYTPRTGDIIFFDWNGNGVTQHVGIVESVADGRVNTIEGNTSDSCARRSYSLDSRQIYGYGIPAY